MRAVLTLQCRLEGLPALPPRALRVQTQGKATAAAPVAALAQSKAPRSSKAAVPRTADLRSSSGSSRQQQLEQQQAGASWQQQVQGCLPGALPSSSYAPAAAAAALGLGALLATAGPAAASELLTGMPSAGAFIPGLVGDDPFREGFIQALLLIFFSEIGDKTFFIALLLALQQPRSLVFTGTFGALAVMTVISVGLGRALHLVDEVIPNAGLPLDDLLAVALLIFFGVQTLRNASTAGDKAAEEKEEAAEVVEGFGTGAQALSLVASTFTLVFAAEWGDKSFLATIALAAASSPTGVVLGAVAGHAIATVIAVLGGSFLGKYLDEKVVQYVGGSLFLVFAAASIYDIAVGAH